MLRIKAPLRHQYLRVQSWEESPVHGEYLAGVIHWSPGQLPAVARLLLQLLLLLLSPDVAEVEVVVAAGEVTQLQLQLVVSWVQVVVEPQHPAVPVQLAQQRQVLLNTLEMGVIIIIMVISIIIMDIVIIIIIMVWSLSTSSSSLLSSSISSSSLS